MTRQNITIRFSEEELEWIKQEAKAQHYSIRSFIRYVLRLYRSINEEIRSEFELGGNSTVEL